MKPPPRLSPRANARSLGHPDEIVLERILCDLFARRFQYPHRIARHGTCRPLHCGKGMETGGFG